MESKNIVWRPSPTVCRCCFNDGCYKDISTEYFWMGKREIYSEMLTDTLDVSISYSQSGGPNSNSRLICEPCIARLRDASDFKKQVLECEKMFLLQLNPDNDSVPSEVELETNESQMKTEEVKIEKLTSVEDFPDSVDFGGTQGEDNVDDDDDLDDEPLTKLASKIPKKEKVDLMDLVDNVKATEKRKSSSKAKSSPAKKAKTKSKTEAAQPSSSGSKVVPKKQKGTPKKIVRNAREENMQVTWKKKLHYYDHRANALLLIDCSNAVPFTWYNGRFSCSFCKLVYNEITEIRTHSEQHPNRIQMFESTRNPLDCIKIEITDLKCNLCSSPIDNMAMLKSHLISEHSKKINLHYGDGVMPFSFQNDQYKCVECGEIFTLFSNLNKHMNRHYQSHICDHCGKGFAAQHRLRAHILSHEVGEYPCAKCGTIFRSRLVLYNHVAKVHGPKDKYGCPHCDAKFTTYGLRNRHLIEEHGLKSEYPCSLCPAVFNLCNARTKHIKNVHVKNKIHNCTMCTSQFVTGAQLRSHMIRHTGERKFQCILCKKTYARPRTLKEHMNTHTEERKYVCVVCQQGFVQNCSLKQHLRVQHPGFLPSN